MNLLFWIYKSRTEKASPAFLMARITHHSKRANINTGLKILPSTWDSKKQRVKGNSELANNVNRHIQTISVRLLYIYDELAKTGKDFTVFTLRDKFQFKGEQHYTLMDVVKQHNDEMKELLGKVFAKNTYRKYTGFEGILRLFLKDVIKNVHLPIDEVNLTVITKLEHYFRTVRKSSSNTATKRLQQLNKIIRYGRKNGMTAIDPFVNYTFRLKPTTRVIITLEELHKIEACIPTTESLRRLKDIFLFQCYTGLSHVDLFKLNLEHIQKGTDGKIWILMNRTKTSTSIKIPLLPIPEKILDKYSAYPVKNNGRLLPVSNNQVMNRNLKKLGLIAGINKSITTHMARHCFATTVTLANGVPIEIVSRLLAHTNIRTTQIYAKVLDANIADAMDKLSIRLQDPPKD